MNFSPNLTLTPRKLLIFPSNYCDNFKLVCVDFFSLVEIKKEGKICFVFFLKCSIQI